jgi:N-acetylglutamate synthase-like GNAT family acetyltransferase
MKIRRLERSDYNQVSELMTEFAKQSNLKSLIKEDYDYEHVYQVLLRCEKAGISFVGQNNDTIYGCILSIAMPDLWVPKTLFLREIAWYVRPEYRHTTLGARLFAAYKKAAESVLESGRIMGFTISKLHNSPDFDYERRGFKFIEATYLIGE